MTLVAVTCKRSYENGFSYLEDGYIEALAQSGCGAVILPPLLPPTESCAILRSMDGLLFSGGGDLSPLWFAQQPHPNLGEVDVLRDEQEMALVKEAIRLGLPILGICRGLQVINAALGGALLQHLETNAPGAIQHRQSAPGWQPHHSVRIMPGTMLAEVLGEGVIDVNSFHHQAVEKAAPDLVVSAAAPDGVLEALESRRPWIMAVQWHPERMFKKYREFSGIFSAFAAACQGGKDG